MQWNKANITLNDVMVETTIIRRVQMREGYRHTQGGGRLTAGCHTWEGNKYLGEGGEGFNDQNQDGGESSQIC